MSATRLRTRTRRRRAKWRRSRRWAGIEPGPAPAPCGWALTRVLFQGRLDVAPQPADHAPEPRAVGGTARFRRSGAASSAGDLGRVPPIATSYGDERAWLPGLPAARGPDRGGGGPAG